MSGCIYTAQFNGVAVTAQQDLFEILAPTTCTVLIHQIILSQTTEIGDTMEEDLLILIKRGGVTAGSGGSTPTPVPVDSRGPAAGTVAKANNTTKAAAGAGTIVTVHSEAWNIRSPFVLLPPPELRIELRGAAASRPLLTVELGTTPADSITMNGTIYFEEL